MAQSSGDVQTTRTTIRSTRLDKLSSFDYRQQQNNILQHYRPIWPWFFDCEQYVNWRKGRPWTLRCYGEPGSGQTTLAAAVAQSLASDDANSNVAVILLLLDHQNDNGQRLYTLPDPVNALWTTILRQLIETLEHQQRSTDISDDLESQLPPLPKIKEHVNSIIRTLFKHVFVVIDDFSQSPPEIQAQFQSEIAQLLGNQGDGSSTGFLTTGHLDTPVSSHTVYCDQTDEHNGHYEPILHRRCQTCEKAGIQFDLCQGCWDRGHRCKPGHILAEKYDEIFVELKTADDAMHEYIRFEIDRAARSTGRYQDIDTVIREVEKNITKTASGKLVVAKTYVDYFVQGKPIDEILDVLDHVAVPEARYFDSLMHRVRRQENEESQLALKILFLVSYASHETRNRYLSAGELSDAIATLYKNDGRDDPTVTQHKMLSVCKGILTLVPGDVTIAKTFHGDLGVYLYENSDEFFQDVNINIANLCLDALITYIRPPSTANDEERFDLGCAQEHPFLVYASQCWGSHLTENCSDEVITGEDLAAKAIGFMQDELKLSASLYMACTSLIDGARTFDVWPGSHALHVCAFFGLSKQLTSMIESKQVIDIDVQDPIYHRTPLIVACQQQKYYIVKELLENGARPDLLGRDGTSAIYYATRYRAAGIVKLFIDRDCASALNLKHGRLLRGQTPLMMAVTTNRFDLTILKQLVGYKEIEANTQDESGKTALMHAILTANEDAVDVLLQMKGISLQLSDQNKRTALHHAVSSGNLNIVKKLLQPIDANSAKPDLEFKDDCLGNTVLMEAVYRTSVWGAEPNDTEIITTLIEAGCDCHCTDNAGRSLMHAASWSDDQVPILEVLAPKDVSPNERDHHGWTALHIACSQNAATVATTLLDLGADLDAITNEGRMSPIDVAWLYGHDTLAEELAKRPPHRPQQASRADPRLRTRPLWSRIRNGECDDAESVTELTHAEISAVDPLLRWTALHAAAVMADTRMADRLLRDGRVDVELKTELCETALHFAVQANPEAVAFLLENGANVATRDFEKRTPLDYARSQDPRSAITMLLIEHSAETIPAGMDLPLMLSAAVQAGNRRVVEKLVEAGANILQHNTHGLLPIHESAESKDPEFIDWVQKKHMEALGVSKKVSWKS